MTNATNRAIKRPAFCVPSYYRQRHCHYFTPSDVTCACGRFPSDLGIRMGLVEHPEREPLFDPWVLIQQTWQARADARRQDV